MLSDLEALTTDVGDESLALIDALCDALILADSDALERRSWTLTYLLIR